MATEGMASPAAAKSPTPVQLRRAFAIGLIAVCGIGGGVAVAFALVGHSGPNSDAIAAGWSSDSAQVYDRLDKAFGDSPAALEKWSPAVTEDGRRYQAIWFDTSDRENVVRAYLDGAGGVQSIAISDSGSDNLARDAKAVVDTAAPKVDAAERGQIAQTLVALAVAGKPSSLTAHGITFGASAGSVHYTVRAKPAA